ncbi:glycosyltransferase [Phenylobacterium sp.]|uniref:glycosyltransferase n=1 Tax=Phenylobacterium sp. TaxID=1871053 RepID=UPI002FCAEAD9
MLRTAFFLNKFPMASEAFIVNTAAGLLDAGHEVDLYGLHGENASGARHALIEQYGLLARSHPTAFADQGSARRWAEAPGAFLRTARKSGAGVALSGLNLSAHRRRWVGMRAIHEAETFQGRGRYDVLHCHFGTLAEPVLRHRRAGALSGAVVVHFRGYDITSHVERRGEDCYEAVFAQADAFVTNSVFFRDRVISLGCPPERITIVESPINIGLFPYAPRALRPGEPVRIVTVGRLVEKKGIAYAIQAVARLRESGRPVEYRIVGEGQERPALERLIGELGLDGAVSMLGEMSQEGIAAELAQAHIFLAPSVRARDGSEDSAINTLKEAMACGVPVVSTWHGGIPELVEDGVSGLLAPERDAPGLAERLEILVGDPALASKFSAAGRQIVERRFSFPVISDQLLKVYEEAVRNCNNSAKSNG